MIKKMARKMEHDMQQNYLTFCLWVWLDQCGITKRLSFWMRQAEDRKLRKNPSEVMVERQKFYMKNKSRVKNVMSMLADDKSRMIYKAAINYRTKHIPIRKGLYEYGQYFVDDIVQIEENEIFIDGGAFIGDTILTFMNKAKKKTNYKIIAFEPDEKNYKLLYKFFGNKKNVIIVKKGLSDKEEDILFEQKGTDGSHFTDDESKANAKIQVINMDAIPECQNATWIKLDVEGAELSALRGAKEIIKRNHPKLTICIYHSDEDMIRIAEYIHEMVPEYKLYIRHHTRREIDIVLYAVI